MITRPEANRLLDHVDAWGQHLTALASLRRDRPEEAQLLAQRTRAEDQARVALLDYVASLTEATDKVNRGPEARGR